MWKRFNAVGWRSGVRKKSGAGLKVGCVDGEVEGISVRGGKVACTGRTRILTAKSVFVR